MAEYDRSSTNRPSTYGELSSSPIFDRTSVTAPTDPIATTFGADGFESTRYEGNWISVPPLWKDKAKDKLTLSKTRPVVIDYWGDSMTVGAGLSDPMTEAYPRLVHTALTQIYTNGGDGFLPISAFGTRTGSWTTTLGFYGPGYSQASASASWEIPITGSTICIPYRNSGVTGSFRYNIDGGSFTTVTTPSGFALDPATILITGLSNTTHTLRIEWVSGVVQIVGQEIRGSAGLVPRIFALSGARAADHNAIPTRRIASLAWTNTSTSVTASPATFTAQDIGKFVAPTINGSGIIPGTTISAVTNGSTATLSTAANGTDTDPVLLTLQDPRLQTTSNLTTYARSGDPYGRAGLGPADIVFIALGVNDLSDGSGAQLGAATLTKGLGHLVNGYLTNQESPLFAFIIMNPALYQGVRGLEYADHATAIRGLANALEAPVIDMWAYGRRNQTYASTSGYLQGDGLHPSAAGHQAIANMIIDLLTLR